MTVLLSLDAQDLWGLATPQLKPETFADVRDKCPKILEAAGVMPTNYAVEFLRVP